MQCPQCQSVQFSVESTCPRCQFLGDVPALEHLSNLQFLLNEAKRWTQLPILYQEGLAQKYGRQLLDVEVKLGLRQPPPTIDEAKAIRLQIAKHAYLEEVLPSWQQRGWITEVVRQRLSGETAVSIQTLNKQLTDAPKAIPLTAQQQLLRQLEQVQFLHEVVDNLLEEEGITACPREGVGAVAHQAISTLLTLRITNLEIQAGLRARPVQKKSIQAIDKDVKANVAQLKKEEKEAIAADTKIVEAGFMPALEITNQARPSKPTQSRARQPKREKVAREPWSWDRLWETLLSERTLKAILFLGGLFLFASAVSWVTLNWRTFHPVVQVGFLGGFTAMFYGLGWVVRVKMKLRGSGMALSGVGSLLVPLDFYAFYISGGFPPNSWPTVWLAGSLVCLAAYLLATYLIQEEFFGYLVAVATGSMVVAAMNLGQLQMDWWQVGIGFVALGLAWGSWALAGIKASAGSNTRTFPAKASAPRNQWRVLAAPFGQMALLTAVSLMVLGAGWGLFLRTTSVFQLALGVSYLLGGATLALMVRRYPMQELVWVAVGAFPVSVWLMMRPFLLSMGIDTAWVALGWALLVPVYLVVGNWLSRGEDRGKQLGYGRVVLRAAGGLTAVSALWAMGDISAAGIVHPLLALSMILAAWLWRQPNWLWVSSLLLFSGSAAWQGGRGAAIAELTLPWTLLSILLIGTAVYLRPSKVRYDAPLFGAGFLTGMVAILPPLLLFDQRLLTYALGNLIGINGWLAYLTHGKTASSLSTMFRGIRKRPLPATLFHWIAALGVIPWFGLIWSNGRSITPQLALGYVGLAWGLLGMTIWVRRLRWQYGRPWQVAAHLSNVAAFGVGLASYEQSWFVGVLVGTAVFYFVAASKLRQSNWLYLGCWLLPTAYISTLDLINLPAEYQSVTFALLILSYTLAIAWLKRRQTRPAYVEPISMSMIVLSLLLILLNTLLLFVWPDSKDIVGVAAGYAVLGLSFGMYSWMTNQSGWNHLSVWLMTAAVGLVVSVYSHGSGISAPLAAVGATLLILTERELHQLARRTKPVRSSLCSRKAWRLWRRPLFVAGSAVGGMAIVAALGRNLFLLGGGTMRETWSVMALSLMVGLYAASAWLYRQPRYLALAATLSFLPWTLLTHLGGFTLSTPVWFGLSWAILASLLLGVGILLARRLGLGDWSWRPQIVAHFLLPFALLWSSIDAAVSSWTVAVGILFYGTAVSIDRHFRTKKASASARFLYPMAFLAPVWALYLQKLFVPTVSVAGVSLLLLAFTLPALALGCAVEKWESSYRWSLYLLAYGSATAATLLMVNEFAGERPLLIAILFFDVGVAILSVWLFREPLWEYVATLLLPIAFSLLVSQFPLFRQHYFGWVLAGLSLYYLVGAWLLTKFKLNQYATPLLVMTFISAGLGLPLSSQSEMGVLVGFGIATAVYSAIAFWKRWPWLLYLAITLAGVVYVDAISLLNINYSYWGLALWPGILFALAMAAWLDAFWGIEPDESGQKLGVFPWQRRAEWGKAIEQRLLRWWALPFYMVAFGTTAVAGVVAVAGEWQWVLSMGLGTAVYTWALFRFRRRGWLLLAAFWAQLTAFTLIILLGGDGSAQQLALAFLPVTLITAVFALFIERVRHEDTPFSLEGGFNGAGYSRPVYLLLAFNLVIGQLLSLSVSGEGTAVTLGNALVVAMLATAWALPSLAYLALLLGAGGVVQFLQWQHLPTTSWPIALALLALAYGGLGYGQWLVRRLLPKFGNGLRVWERPLRVASWIISLLSLLSVLVLGVNVLALAIRAAFGTIYLSQFDLLQIRMMIQTFAILGLFYLLTAVAERRHRIGYGALLLLLSSWSLWLLLIAVQTNLQLYALPVAIYLLAIGWLEMRTGQTNLARWIDRMALLLLFGSVFWQSFGEYGGLYALLMIVEGLLIAWLGSWRRLRRFLYVGVTAVVVAVAGQLIEPLLALNTLVLLLLGASLVGLGIGLERRLEKVRALSKEFRNRLEEWD